MNHLKKSWGFGIILGLCIIIIGVSFAFWYLNLEQTTPNVVVSDCFRIEFTEGNAIHLDQVYPVSDEEGLKGIAYTFTLKNACESNVTYQINLETLNGSEKGYLMSILKQI